MNRLLHPSFEIQKAYLTKVSNNVTDQDIRTLRKGVMIEGKLTSPAEVRLIRHDTFSTDLLITIHEGRNREVRRMMEYFHRDVKRLIRIEYGFLTLGNLRQGQYRKLRSYEVRKLMEMAEKNQRSMK